MIPALIAALAIVPHLGELRTDGFVVALETVRREAEEAGRPLGAHLTHLLVHGVLHLLGYDHEIESDAVRMEAREIELLARLNITNPYSEILS